MVHRAKADARSGQWGRLIFGPRTRKLSRDHPEVLARRAPRLAQEFGQAGPKSASRKFVLVQLLRTVLLVLDLLGFSIKLS